MCCYIVPTAAALIHFFMRKKITNFNNKSHLWLNQLLFGGAIFGIIDHWWNGELLSFSIADTILGFTILGVILLVWVFMIVYDKWTFTQKVAH